MTSILFAPAEFGCLAWSHPANDWAKKQIAKTTGAMRNIKLIKAASMHFSKKMVKFRSLPNAFFISVRMNCFILNYPYTS